MPMQLQRSQTLTCINTVACCSACTLRYLLSSVSTVEDECTWPWARASSSKERNASMCCEKKTVSQHANQNQKKKDRARERLEKLTANRGSNKRAKDRCRCKSTVLPHRRPCLLALPNPRLLYISKHFIPTAMIFTFAALSTAKVIFVIQAKWKFPLCV